MADAWKNLWLTTMSPFYESYPFVSKGIVEIHEQGDGLRKMGNSPEGFNVMDFGSFNGNIPCSNPKCQGGVSILNEVDEMMKTREAERETYKTCSGRPKNDVCCNGFKLRIRLTYKD
ncbi:MAG: hypothetical protein ACLGSA_12660 [Acidobacteriota bacterium]